VTSDDGPVEPARFITWINGQCVSTSRAKDLVAHAAARHVSSFVAWEIDHENEEVIHLLAAWVPDRWEFYDGTGEVRFVVGGRLHQWAVAYLAHAADQADVPTLIAIAVPPNGWGDEAHHPLYAPLGFAPPVRHPSGWTYRWAPDTVAEHLANLSQTEREAFLDTMYVRLAAWTQLAERGMMPDAIERALDIRMIEMDDPGWRLTNQLLVSALGE
jgi:hypothetical protein